MEKTSSNFKSSLTRDQLILALDQSERIRFEQRNRINNLTATIKSQAEAMSNLGKLSEELNKRIKLLEIQTHEPHCFNHMDLH